MWMVDGYTTMANYPYSERQSLSDADRTRSLRKDQTGHPDQLHPQLGEGDGRRLRRHGEAVRVGRQATRCSRRGEGLPRPGQAEARDAGRRCSAHVRYPQDLFDVQRGAARAVPHQRPGGVLQRQRQVGRAGRPVRRRRRRPAAVLRAGQLADRRRGAPHAAVPADDADGGQQLAQPRGLHLGRQRSRARLRQDHGAHGADQVRRSRGRAGRQRLQVRARSSPRTSRCSTAGESTRDPRQPADPAAGRLVPLRRAAVRAVDLGTTAFPTLQRVLVTYGGKNSATARRWPTRWPTSRHNRTAGASLEHRADDDGANGGSGSKTPSSSASPTSPARPVDDRRRRRRPPGPAAARRRCRRLLTQLDQATHAAATPPTTRTTRSRSRRRSNASTSWSPS